MGTKSVGQFTMVGHASHDLGFVVDGERTVDQGRGNDLGHQCLEAFDSGRRTVYAINQRNLPLPLLQEFDFPTRTDSCRSERARTLPHRR